MYFRMTRNCDLSIPREGKEDRVRMIPDLTPIISREGSSSSMDG